jgi:hypothetical protein
MGNNVSRDRKTARNLAISLTLAMAGVATGAHWFHRARNTAACSSGCLNNLRLIEGAKDQWAIEYHRTNREAVSVSDITPYIKFGLPVCPEGGTYSIHAIGINATCSLAGKGNLRQAHELP